MFERRKKKNNHQLHDDDDDDDEGLVSFYKCLGHLSNGEYREGWMKMPSR